MNLGDITNLVIAVTSTVAIIIAVYTFWKQNNQAKQFLGIQILREWESFFFSSPDMCRRRYVTCRFFKSGGKPPIPYEAWDLLDTFDSIATYFNRRIVEDDLAWSTYYYWLDMYWYLLKPHVDALHASTEGVPYLKDVDEMYRKLTKFGERHKKLPSSKLRFSEVTVAEFLDDEMRATYDPDWESGDPVGETANLR